MTPVTVVDTNVMIEWLEGGTKARACADLLGAMAAAGSLVVPSIVYSELAAGDVTPSQLDAILQEAGITVDWAYPRSAALAAGTAWKMYAEQRRRTGGSAYICETCGRANHEFRCAHCGGRLTGGPKHLLPDFQIGAYALAAEARLVTSERRGGLYRTYFPRLALAIV